MTPLGWRCLEEAPDAACCEVRAGSAVVFSSLTPHATGPNRTCDVRKSYIVQFAPDGARIVATNGDGSASTEQLCNDARRQFPILIEGKSPA
jgi:ectoine hydroxylase-related dioxygenase (phytanoyl-CoA dioxygenase family)